ncbi:hypothetical protein ACQKGD_15210 [Peribacillus frigoritolerans]|uniref:hypothetical protein n=1 Tax=Peribacillus frigoritolerans TaxID=450367 RepID=UPI003D048FA4
MTVSELLDEYLKYYKAKHKRYTFITKRTKNKRIKNKAIQQASFALRMTENMEEVIRMRRSD